MRHGRGGAGVVLASLVLVAATAATGWLPFQGAMATHAIASGAWLWLVASALWGGWRPRLLPVLVAALALRAVCLPQPMSLSDDVYRYLHEGGMVVAGANPYAVAPDAVEPQLRGPYHDRINNPDIPAAYPPAVQYALAAGALLSEHPLGMKLVFGGADLLLFLLLWWGLPLLGAARRCAVVHGLCPLLAVEFAGQAHSDSLAALCVTAALLAAARGRAALLGAALACGTAAKLMPVALLPFALRHASPWRIVTVFAVVLVALWWPFWIGVDTLRGTLEYAGRWRSNDSLFALVYAATDAFVSLGWMNGFDSVWLKESQRLAKLPIAAMVGVILWLAWRRRLPLPRVAFWLFAFFLVAAPTVHPWYVVLVVPTLCIYPNVGVMLFTASVFAAYHVLPAWLAERRWEEVTWIVVVEYVPLWSGLLIELWRPSVAPPPEASASA